MWNILLNELFTLNQTNYFVNSDRLMDSFDQRRFSKSNIVFGLIYLWFDILCLTLTEVYINVNNEHLINNI